jgi:hypothetical protein
MLDPGADGAVHDVQLLGGYRRTHEYDHRDALHRCIDGGGNRKIPFDDLDACCFCQGGRPLWIADQDPHGLRSLSQQACRL